MFKSTKATIALSCCLVFVMTLFVSVGYARVIDALTISGTVEYEKDPALIFIVDAKVIGTSGNNVTGDVKVEKDGPYVLEMKNYDFTLKKQEGGTAGGSVTIEVTVKNNSGIDQHFAGYKTDPALSNSSNDVKITYGSIALGDTIIHDEVKTFTITIQNGTYNKDISFNGKKGILQFAADYKQITEIVAKNVADKFKEVLNGHAKITYNKTEYTGSAILDLIMTNSSNSDTGDYIGNVGNADATKQAIMKAIFEESLFMDIGNTRYTVWFLIKRQEVDGQNNGTEANHDMMLYITADPLDQGGPENNFHYVPVYAIVYTYNSGTGDKYTQCPHLFAGEAPVCNWGGSFGNNNTGNIHTHYWRSTEDAYKNIKDQDTGNRQDGAIDEVYAEYLKNPSP